jgi:CubicO group peptidase (beta-lactamase class C family)
MKIDPESAGMDVGRLQRIDEHLKIRYLEPGKIAGCQVAVVRRGVIAHYTALGFADRERQIPVAEDTIWRIYSMTKPVTAVALMTLYERGHFQLDDPVSRFIPAWKNMKVAEVGDDGQRRLVESHRPVRIKDLMMHTAGLGYGHDNDVLDVARVGDEGGARSWFVDSDLDAMVARLAETPLRFHPGTRWLYSLGLDVCGKLIEIMSGKRLDQFLVEEIFSPLGMKDTAFYVRETDRCRFAANYARDSTKQLVLVDDPATSSYLSPPTFLAGGGGLVSTIGDYVRFCRMLVEGGEVDGRRILGRKTIELIATNHLPRGGELSQLALPGSHGEVGFDGRGFGLGVAVNVSPAATGVIGSAGEFMWGGGASTTFWVDPSEDLAVVFMTQLMPSAFNFPDQLRALVYPAIVD